MRLVPSPEQQSLQRGANMAMAQTFARRAVVRRSPCKIGGARGEHTRRRAQASRIRLPIGPDKGGTPPPFRPLIQYPPQIAAEAARGGVLAPPELRALRSLEAALSGHGVAPGGDGKRLVPAFGG